MNRKRWIIVACLLTAIGLMWSAWSAWKPVPVRMTIRFEENFTPWLMRDAAGMPGADAWQPWSADDLCRLLNSPAYLRQVMTRTGDRLNASESLSVKTWRDSIHPNRYTIQLEFTTRDPSKGQRVLQELVHSFKRQHRLEIDVCILAAYGQAKARLQLASDDPALQQDVEQWRRVIRAPQTGGTRKTGLLSVAIEGDRTQRRWLAVRDEARAMLYRVRVQPWF